MEPTQSTDRTRHVEELEGQDDYWLSITDAARICRVQDVSIRRAISAGRLPVRAQGAGDNKRTRFVRASDLPRANFPIVDSGAAITSDIRKVDILNIPLQIQRLTEQLAQIQEAQRTLSERYQQDQQTIQEQTKQIQADLGALQKREETTNRRFTTLEDAQKDLALREQQEREAMQGRWQTALTEMEQRQAGRIDGIVTQVQQIQTSLQEQVQQVEIRLPGLVQQAEERLLAQFQADLAALRKEFEERVRAQANRIDALTRQIAQEKEQRVDFERIMTKVATGADAAASDAKATVATLVSQLQAERTARQALEDRLSRLEAQESAKTPAQPSTRKPSTRRKTTEPPA